MHERVERADRPLLQLVERAAGDELEGQERAPRVEADLVHADDMRVVKAREEGRLLLEAQLGLEPRLTLLFADALTLLGFGELPLDVASDGVGGVTAGMAVGAYLWHHHQLATSVTLLSAARNRARVLSW